MTDFHPFSVINNESIDVKNKFLSGLPHQEMYPGPFPGTQKGDNYMNSQHAAIQNYGNISQDNINKYTHDTPSCETFHDEKLSNPCNQTGFGKIVPEFVPDFMTKASSHDTPLLNVGERPTNHFTHNNMVPYYGHNVTQNMKGTGVPQAGDNNKLVTGESPYRQKLSSYTGCDKEYMHKRETETMFSPAEAENGWVFGAPAIRPDLNRYKDTIWQRNGETPVEPIRVGPGIGIDYSMPAQGGFHQFNRILPNNVSDYKANQLEGRVNAGKWAISHPTSQFTEGIVKNRPDKVFTQARRPTMKSGFHTNAPSGNSSGLTNHSISVSRGRQNRNDTEQSGGFGQLSSDKSCIEFSDAPIGMIMGSSVPKTTQDRESFRNIRETRKKTKVKWVNGHYQECEDDTQGANEWGLTLGGATGGTNKAMQRDGYYVNLTDRGDANNHVMNVSGMASGHQKWNPNSFTDNQKTTKKEMLSYAHQGNIAGGVSHTSNSWQDNQKVTKKEMSAYSHQGGATGNVAHTSKSWDDNAKTTRKETSLFSHHGGASQGGGTPTDRFMFDGGDSTRIECFEDIIPDIDHKKWRRGGMTSNGLRAATEVVNHFNTPGRQNLLPDPTQFSKDPNIISSIGNVQHNGLGGSTSGPGTFMSTNIQIGGGAGIQMQPISEAQIGQTLQNDKRSQYVDYRQTDPFIVENLKNNPLSIYAVGNAKNAEIPEFFVHTKPSSYGSHTTTKNIEPDSFTREMIIDGSPQSNILGLGDNNPMMGLKNVVNENVEFPGKAYGGENHSSSIKKMYSEGWKGGHFCTNKALQFSSPGYQVEMGTFNHEGRDKNLPWDQMWQQSSGSPSTQQKVTQDQRRVNNYTNGLPGSLISN